MVEAQELIRLASAHAESGGCPHCAALICPGWEAFPVTAEESNLQRIGALRRSEQDDLTLDEYHPQGTNYWSDQAPIALNFHPYNRCELWVCVTCGRPFLRYTEYGGYYEERRIREVRAELISEVVHTA